MATVVTSSYEEAVAETVERYRAMAAALEAECAALAETLDLVTHEFEPDNVPGVETPEGAPVPSVFCAGCYLRVDAPEHRTAAWVRKRHRLGAT